MSQPSKRTWIIFSAIFNEFSTMTDHVTYYVLSFVLLDFFSSSIMIIQSIRDYFYEVVHFAQIKYDEYFITYTNFYSLYLIVNMFKYIHIIQSKQKLTKLHY